MHHHNQSNDLPRLQPQPQRQGGEAEERAALLAEIRYGERLCQRTARLYRNLQSAGTWLSVVGGSVAFSQFVHSMPQVIPLAGVFLFSTVGAAMIAIRPGDKAVANELDVKKYAALRAESMHLGIDQIRAGIYKARQTDAPEIESLRNVAYNDVMLEIGGSDGLQKLSASQRVLAALV